MTDNFWSVGEFARRVGVSVRTLQYYDKIDLLKPTAYSQTGRRLYGKSAVPKIQQIITLKYIGLSLEEIRDLLSTESIAVDDLVSRQKLALREKVRQLQQIITTIEVAEAMFCTSEIVNLQQFIEIIREVQVSNQTDWFGQFFTDGQQAKISKRVEQQSLDEQRREGQALKQLFIDIETYLAGDTDGKTVEELATRWQQIIQAYVQGDDDLHGAIETAYTQVGMIANWMNLSDEARDWMQTMQDSAQFISKRSE